MTIKTETLSEKAISQLIFSTGAVSIWDHENGPVFWYAANVPGPFYVNTEQLIGSEISAKILDEITHLLASNNNREDVSEKLWSLILSEYKKNENYRKIVSTMIERSKSFGENYNVISGGERRDWFFSIPMSYETKKNHLFVFKNGETYLKEEPSSEEVTNKKALHIADLIHNAASYFNSWIPMLDKSGYELVGTMSVINREHMGINKLKEAGIKCVTLKGIDSDFFKELCDDGIISNSLHTELVEYFNSKADWAKTYILRKTELIQFSSIDEKSQLRCKSFFTDDPWNIVKDLQEANDIELPQGLKLG